MVIIYSSKTSVKTVEAPVPSCALSFQNWVSVGDGDMGKKYVPLSKMDTRGGTILS